MELVFSRAPPLQLLHGGRRPEPEAPGLERQPLRFSRRAAPVRLSESRGLRREPSVHSGPSPSGRRSVTAQGPREQGAGCRGNRSVWGEEENGIKRGYFPSTRLFPPRSLRGRRPALAGKKSYSGSRGTATGCGGRGRAGC